VPVITVIREERVLNVRTERKGYLNSKTGFL